MSVTFLTSEDEKAFVKSINGVKPDPETGDVAISSSGGNGNGLSTEASALLITILRNGVYSADQSDNITALATELGVTEEEQPDTPIEPDEPDAPEVTLSSISATYSGGDVAVGTAVADLTGIVVTAHYSDGTSKAVTGYTLSGTIAEGSNTITVSYGGKTTTFFVTGVAEPGGEPVPVSMLDEVTNAKAYFYSDDSLSANQVDTVKDMLKANGTNFNWFSDAGNTAVSDNSLTTRGNIQCQTSQNVFSEDTELKVLIHNAEMNTYDNYIIGCTNWDGVSTPSATDVFYCQSIGTNAWNSNADHEVSYTVKAGYRFFIASYTSNTHRVFLIPVGTELASVTVTKIYYVSFSEAVFDEDATVRITASSSAQTYGSVWAWCSDSNGTAMLNTNGYFTQQLDNQGWKTPYSFEGTYAVKAGYRLAIGSHWSRVNMDEFKVEVV